MSLFRIYHNGAKHDFPLKYYFTFSEDTTVKHSNGKMYNISAGKGSLFTFKNGESLFADHHPSSLIDKTPQIH